MDKVDLATIQGLEHALKGLAPSLKLRGVVGTWDGTYCAHCGELRRMRLMRLFWSNRWPAPALPGVAAIAADSQKVVELVPALFAAICLQCENPVTLLIFPGPQGMQLVALPSTYGGLATPLTPQSVAFYLDQAQKSQAMGALSAAVAMYRAALEHVLYEQGYKDGMLGNKIAALEEDENAPVWRDRLGNDYLRVINRLGNAAIHANDGDVRQQSVLEAKLLSEVRELFIELLDEVYEQPQKRAGRLASLRSAVTSIENPATPAPDSSDVS